MAVAVRPATIADAATIADLVQALSLQEGYPAPPLGYFLGVHEADCPGDFATFAGYHAALPSCRRRSSRSP
jgi:hypothetical protein